jgi:Tol biopolymer transport system component/tRNA A-37 threonylcarbamoyl transferase component Bud32
VIGKTLSHFRIVAKIGEGGMGVVYRARDEKLRRDVALKVPPPELTANEQSRLRFLREARAAAAVTHPNIATVYEVGEAEGVVFIAMELVEGRPLRALLGERTLPVRQLMGLATEIAEGLSRAHQARLVHRDLKPDNMLVGTDGHVKILDFGLAKLLEASAEGGSLGGLAPSQQETASEVMTQQGGVVGTVAYMSPEQLQGQRVDARSDIFSFGVVLYEMATGRSPFLRASAASTMAAILRDRPQPVDISAGNLPAEMQQIISKALEKQVEFRYQSSEDLAADLRRLRRDLEARQFAAAGSKAAAPVHALRRWRAGLWTSAAMVFILVAIWGLLVRKQEPSGPTPTRVIHLTALPGLEEAPTWSPDNRSIAYASDVGGNLDIYLQQISGGPAIRLTDSDADDAQPAWSPDGSKIAFVSARAYPEKRLSALLNFDPGTSNFAGRNGDIWIMASLGGTARRIVEDAYYPIWSPDGKTIVYQASREGRWGLWIQEIDRPSQSRALDLGGLSAPVVTHPAWSPDGKWIAFSAGGGEGARIYAIPNSGGGLCELTGAEATAMMPTWSPDGQWLFFSSDRGGEINLWKARFVKGRLDEPIRVTAGQGADFWARPSPDGTRLAYSTLRSTYDLWEYTFKSAHSLRLTTETTLEDNPRPSPDGFWLAFASDRMGRVNVWLLNRKDGMLTQVSNSPSGVALKYSHWSSDGRRLLYADSDGIWSYEIDTGTTRKFFDVQPPGDHPFFCVTAGNRDMVLERDGLLRINMGSGTRAALIPPSEGLAREPACSPDGMWVAYHLERGNVRKIWIVPLAGGISRQLTFGKSEDSHPTWSSDNRSVYFVRDHQNLYVVPLTGSEAQALTDLRSFNTRVDYPAATADGERVLFTRHDMTGDIYILEYPSE